MNKYCGKRLALMGTENGANEVSDFCKKNGITLVSFGNRPEAVIHKVSDEQCYVNCTDADVMIPLMKEKEIDGVFLATSESVIRKAIHFLPEAGYRHYATPEQWNTLMNKALFKKYAKKFDVNTIPEYEVDVNTNTVTGDISFPVVVKPADSCGSVGISVCNSMGEVEQAIIEAKKFTSSGMVICEKFMSGEFFLFDIWMRDGKAYFPFEKERVFYAQVGSHPEQPFLDIAPASSASLIRECFYEKIEKLFDSLKILNGQCWFQGFIEDGVPYLMDIGFRLNGGKDWKIVQEEKGIDLIESYIQYALTGQFGDDFSCLEKPIEHSYATICIGLKNGTIGKIEGLDEMKNLPGVVNFYQYYFEGQTITTSGLFSQSVCRVLVKTDNHKELKKKVREVLDKISVLDENGESMLLDYPKRFYEWDAE